VEKSGLENLLHICLTFKKLPGCSGRFSCYFLSLAPGKLHK
jgi:hypothetical protein